MAETKYVDVRIVPAVNAGTALGETQIVTPDDSLPRTVTGILGTNQTKLVQTVLMKTGKPIAVIDGGVMAQQRGFIDVNEQYDAGLPITVDFRNFSAGNVAANTDAIVIRYTV